MFALISYKECNINVLLIVHHDMKKKEATRFEDSPVSKMVLPNVCLQLLPQKLQWKLITVTAHLGNDTYCLLDTFYISPSASCNLFSR